MALHGSCHCGAVQFDIDGAIPAQLTRCTCSFCAKRGALYAYYDPQQVRVSAADDAQGVYRWNRRMIAHGFCRHCGMATVTDSPAFAPDGAWDGQARRLAVNARLFDHFDAASAEVVVIDGKSLW